MPEDDDLKAVDFLGNSLKTIREFPEPARQRVGNEIHRLQRGANPTDFKPMKGVGAGVFEIRVDEADSWFRAFYVTKFGESIYILHAFEKKRNKTSPRDIKTGKTEYSALVQRRKKEAKDG